MSRFMPFLTRNLVCGGEESIDIDLRSPIRQRLIGIMVRHNYIPTSGEDSSGLLVLFFADSGELLTPIEFELSFSVTAGRGIRTIHRCAATWVKSLRSILRVSGASLAVSIAIGLD